MSKINIMDVTLRDGSYAINFQFSCLDVKNIGCKLEKSGIKYIEIGHGMGLNASSLKNGVSLNTDEEYLKVAQENIKKSKYGMFCIPGIARLEDIDMAAEYGMSFIRIGTNIDDVKKSKKYIERAKKHGMEVMANYMKSYTALPKQFSENVKYSESYGADVIYVVDSAGGMFYEDLKKYYDAIRKVSNIKLGFHGHDNLGLALANSLYAVELGFDFVDSSLQGLGRSSGNASTELLVSCMKKKLLNNDYNYKDLLIAGKKYVQPLLKNKGINPLDVVCGISEFHTSYMKYIHKYSSKYSVSPLQLIYEYCKYDKINLDEKLLDKVASKLPKETVNIGEYAFENYIGNEQKEI